MDLLQLFKRPKKEDLFSKYPDGILVVSLEGKVLDVNEKALNMFGFSRLEIVGQFFSAFIDGGTNLLNKIISTSQPMVSRAKTNTKDGSFFEISASRDTQGQKVYVSLRDVTQRHKMQNMVNTQYEIAKSIIDEKNTYLNAISGEILSSLASIEGFSKALCDGIGGVLIDKQMKYVSIIQNNASDLNYDLEKLFCLFQMESNLYPFEYRSFDIVNLLNSLVEQYQEKFKKKRVLFDYDFSTFANRGVYCDPNVCEYLVKTVLEIFNRFVNLGQVTFNAGNAPVAFLQKHNFEGKVDEDTNSYMLFEMKANEFVFESEELKDIFEPYLNPIKTKRSVGLKLAFVLLRKFARALKGDIWIYSKQGYGTIFTIVLPCVK